MSHRGVFPADFYLIRATVVLTVLASMLASGSFSLTANNSRGTYGSPLQAACSAPCFENFDTVVPPALPAGWTAVSSQPAVLPWGTINSTSDSTPNSALQMLQPISRITGLNSRTFTKGSSAAVLTFKRKNNLEDTFDGMVLEIQFRGFSTEHFRTSSRPGARL